MEVYAEDIGACMEITQEISPDIQVDYNIMKRWYLHASVSQPNPSWADPEKVSGEYAALYQQKEISPMGWTVPTHISPFKIDDRFSKVSQQSQRWRQKSSG